MKKGKTFLEEAKFDYCDCLFGFKVGFLFWHPFLLFPHMMIEKDKCVYTKCYCEENIYMLCKEIDENYPEIVDKFTVVFISNDERKVSLVVYIIYKIQTFVL